MTENQDTQWDLWEVFTQRKSGTPFIHQGNVHASDKETALQNARDVFTRRERPYSMWVVPTNQIVSSMPEDAESLFDPGMDKPYRHPRFYKISKGVNLDID
jgi:ring-1,2-phenylacetyl-CoA epoxidase subunit PaaB